ncbi:MAG: YceI family protein [Pseudobacteriovorax sp.]|nr:YceI family protein [Pseudobacteriovorax sp.]
MTSLRLSKVFVFAGAVCMGAGSAQAAELALDEISFFAPANVATFNVEGTASEVSGSAEFDNGLVAINAVVPISSLDTGIALRNTNMREKIFTAEDGTLPDIEFSASEFVCEIEAVESCEVTGTMSFQGKTRPLTVSIDLEPADEGTLIKASAVILLSDYETEPPSLFGVSIQNEVTLDISVKALAD